MSRGTKFATSINGQNYNFVNNVDVTITLDNGVYKFSNLSIFEGTYLNFKYTASTSDIDQRFIMLNDNVDTTTLTVKVQNSSSDSTTNTYTLADGLTGLTLTSQVYFLQEVENGRYEVYFGDGVLGKAIVPMVILSYSITSIVIKTCTKQCFNFYFIRNDWWVFRRNYNNYFKFNWRFCVESISSIKYNALRDYASQDRAVTAEDYKVLVKSLYANAQAVQVFGGEDVLHLLTVKFLYQSKQNQELI